MDLPFTQAQFLGVFKSYNEAIFPAHILAYALGLLCVFLLFRNVKYSGRIIYGILSVFWIWMGAVYHIAYFSSINKAAYGFGALFILEGLIFLYQSLFGKPGEFKFSGSAKSYIGLAMIAFAMAIYSAIGYFAGHSYPYSPVFGVAPCPVAIFTFGMLLQPRSGVKFWVIIIPLLWSFLGFFAALQLGITEDFGLLISGVLAAALLALRPGQKEGSLT